MELDPERTCYERLLAEFWESHDPGARVWSRQYMAAVFPHNEEQAALAEASAERVAGRRGRPVTTAILPGKTFYVAEDYHQKYYLQQTPRLMREFKALYPDFQRLVASTAAARVNGYLTGNGSPDRLEAELAELGLSAEGQEYLRSCVRRRVW